MLFLVAIAAHAFAQDSVKLSGTILNKLSDTLELMYNDNNIAYYPKTFYAYPDKKGNFKCTFPIPANVYTQVEIRHGNKLAEVVLHSGDSLHITINAKRFDSSIHYTGKGSEIQNFIALHTLEKGRMNQYTSKLKLSMAKEPEDFVKSIALEQEKEMQFMDKHKAKLPAQFITYWKSFFRYYNYFFTEQYPATSQMMKLKRYTDTIPTENYKVEKDLPYAFNDSMLQLPPYLLYLTGIFDTRMKADGYTAYNKDTMRSRVMEDSIYTIAYKLLPDRSAEFFIAQNLYGRAKNQSLERTQKQYATFIKHWPQSPYIPLLQQQVQTAERLAPGQPAPDIDINTPDGKHLKLSDLKGSVVYIGFWGSFCRQCVAEMTAEKKIKDFVKGKPVVFLYISIDNDTAMDNTLASRYKIDGLFTHADNGWQSKEVKLYGVQGLPAYFLVDEDGKFAAQRPASPTQTTELLLQIGKLLK